MSDERSMSPLLQLGINLALIAFGALIVGTAGASGLWIALILGGSILGVTAVVIIVWQLVLRHDRENSAAWAAYMRELRNR